MPAYRIQYSSKPPDAQVKATAYGLSVTQVVWGGGARSDPRGGRGSKGVAVLGTTTLVRRPAEVTS